MLQILLWYMCEAQSAIYKTLQQYIFNNALQISVSLMLYCIYTHSRTHTHIHTHILQPLASFSLSQSNPPTPHPVITSQSGTASNACELEYLRVEVKGKVLREVLNCERMAVLEVCSRQGESEQRMTAW